MPNNDRFEYDVALSFAQEDRPYAEELGSMLGARDMKVLYDETQAAELGGGNFVTHLAELYRTKALYCVMLISQHYPLKAWTEAERTDAQEHALRDANEYLVPVLLDDRVVPGITATSGSHDLRKHSMESIADRLEAKLSERERQSGAPPESHDLRSGNVPSRNDRNKRQGG